MDVGSEIKLYRERWKAVEEIERHILDSSGRKKYNLIKRFLVCLGMLQDNDVEQMQIMLRWAKLKDLYEQRQFSQSK